MEAESTTDKVKDDIMKFVDKITETCFEARNEPLPVVPSRVEIQESIRVKKDKSVDDAPSMHKAFHTHYTALCKLLNNEDTLENATDAQVKEVMIRWNAFSKLEIDGTGMNTLCAQHDPRVIQKINEKFPSLKVPNTIDDAIWTNIAQLNGFSAVVTSIPTNMMGHGLSAGR